MPNEIKLARTRELVDRMDISKLETFYEVPPCPECGKGCLRNARKGVWEHCNYSLPIPVWDAVKLHATVLGRILEDEGITAITFYGHPLSVKEAVSPTMLLPLFILAASDLGATINQPALLTVAPTSDEMDNTGTLLLPFYIVLNDAGCTPPDSLTLCAAAAREAVRWYREQDPTGSIMPVEFVYDLTKIPVAA